MPMRLSGLMSGMDTETIIQELVAARRTKVDKTKKTQTKLSWTQEVWKGLNTKIKNLQSKYINNMRFVSSYSKKTTKVSDSNAASVLTGGNAVNGVQTLNIENLAKTAYMTGGKVDGNGKEVNALSKLSDIGITEEGTFSLKAGDKTVDITVNGDTTISDVLTQLKGAGVNANFDAKQQRFFISAKESGKASDFSLTALDANGEAALAKLGLKIGTDSEKDATKIDGQDAVIYLNGAKFTNKDNVFEINGLTITALSETKPGEEITITTQDDVDGIYDMVKNFLKEYNSIVNEIDKLYNADPAKGYEPLTDEEKDVMSEKEVEKYEAKIKDALLRRDSNLSSVGSALKDIMSSGLDIDGKTMYLSDFGIETLGYFQAPDNEKNAYHIFGDADDNSTSGKEDKLKNMIANDSGTVISFFSELSKKLYSKLDNMSKSVDGYRSYGNFYDDKKMKSDYDDYTKKIAEMEAKLNEYEDKWYAKFSKMETAMAKMQKSTSALSGLLGGF